jgi:hypothetical protein
MFDGYDRSRIRRRFGGGAISMNSNEPGDTLFTAATISGIFGSMLGQIFDPRTTIEILRRSDFVGIEYSGRRSPRFDSPPPRRN